MTSNFDSSHEQIVVEAAVQAEEVVKQVFDFSGERDERGLLRFITAVGVILHALRANVEPVDGMTVDEVLDDMMGYVGEIIDQMETRTTFYHAN